MRKLKRKWIVSLVCIVIIVFGCGFYVNDYYVAGDKALLALDSTEKVQVQEFEQGNYIFHGEGNTKGLIFYPGGKVEQRAYAPLLKCLAENGISCVLVKMPFNLAVLDMNAADGIQKYLPEVKQWYIGGHSLGGSMAASYVGKHQDAYDGLILFAAYSTEDLSDTKLQVLSIYGSEDGVLNLEKYNKYKSNLPQNYLEMVIDGGNHAGFGDYEKASIKGQKGDGKPTISSDEQIKMTVDWILKNLNEK